MPPGANVCVAAPGVVLRFYDGSGGGGALGAIPPLPPPAGPGAESRPKSNLVHFYPQNIPSEESKLSDFCSIWEHLKVANDIYALFCDLGGCTIYYIWEAKLCVWGLSPMTTPVHAFVFFVGDITSTPAPAALAYQISSCLLYTSDAADE